MSIEHPDLGSGCCCNEKYFMDQSLRRRVEGKRTRTSAENAGNNPPPPPPETLVAHNAVPQAYPLLNGQHRVAAVRAMQKSEILPADEAVPVKVLAGSTPEVIAVSYDTK